MTRLSRIAAAAAVLLVLAPFLVSAYSMNTSRRGWIHAIGVGIIGETLIPPMAQAAVTAPATPSPLERLVEARDTLDKLLSNWKRATVDCTFADVPRELLETKNKQLLLEKASTFALFDKSVSVETCKTTNKIVRDYLGVTGKGPLVGIEKTLRNALAFLADPDDLEAYVNGTWTIWNNIVETIGQQSTECKIGHGFSPRSHLVMIL
jgi:hypothetical protein